MFRRLQIGDTADYKSALQKTARFVKHPGLSLWGTWKQASVPQCQSVQMKSRD
jgi:hypothetical protein